MPNLTLTDARVRAFRPRRSAYDIRDAKLRGFGVRVLPSGAKRFFLHIQHRGQRVWNIVGDANAMPVAQARTQAASTLAAIRFGTDAPGDSPPFESGRSASARQQADIIRLLLLTGCRRNEILALRWAEVHPDALADSKTGPRKVPLNAKARRLLVRQPRGESPFVFPSPRDPSRPRTTDLSLWDTVRREAGIEDVRLHTLRHTVASHAVMNGVPVPVVSRLLGHANAQMTLRYAHLVDRDIEAAAERVGAELARMMALA